MEQPADCYGGFSASKAVGQYNNMYNSFHLPNSLIFGISIYHSISCQYCAMTSQPRQPGVAGSLTFLFSQFSSGVPQGQIKGQVLFLQNTPILQNCLDVIGRIVIYTLEYNTGLSVKLKIIPLSVFVSLSVSVRLSDLCSAFMIFEELSYMIDDAGVRA